MNNSIRDNNNHNMREELRLATRKVDRKKIIDSFFFIFSSTKSKFTSNSKVGLSKLKSIAQKAKVELSRLNKNLAPKVKAGLSKLKSLTPTAKVVLEGFLALLLVVLLSITLIFYVLLPSMNEKINPIFDRSISPSYVPTILPSNHQTTLPTFLPSNDKLTASPSILPSNNKQTESPSILPSNNKQPTSQTATKTESPTVIGNMDLMSISISQTATKTESPTIIGNMDLISISTSSTNSPTENKIAPTKVPTTVPTNTPITNSPTAASKKYARAEFKAGLTLNNMETVDIPTSGTELEEVVKLLSDVITESLPNNSSSTVIILSIAGIPVYGIQARRLNPPDGVKVKFKVIIELLCAENSCVKATTDVEELYDEISSDIESIVEDGELGTKIVEKAESIDVTIFRNVTIDSFTIENAEFTVVDDNGNELDDASNNPSTVRSTYPTMLPSIDQTESSSNYETASQTESQTESQTASPSNDQTMPPSNDQTVSPTNYQTMSSVTSSTSISNSPSTRSSSSTSITSSASLVPSLDPPTPLPTKSTCAEKWEKAIECGATENWAKEICCAGYECNPKKNGQCIERPSQEPSELPSHEPTVFNVPTILPTIRTCVAKWGKAIECGATENWAKETCCIGYECNPNKPGQCREKPFKEPSRVPSNEPTTFHVPTTLPTKKTCASTAKAIECGATEGWARDTCCPGYECDPNRPGNCRERPSQEPFEVPSYIPALVPSQEPMASHIPTILPTRATCAYGRRKANECGASEGWAKESCCPGYECDPNKPGQCKESVLSQEPSEVPSHSPSQTPTKVLTRRPQKDSISINDGNSTRSSSASFSNTDSASGSNSASYSFSDSTSVTSSGTTSSTTTASVAPSQEPTASQGPTVSQNPTTSQVPTDLPTKVTCAYGWRYAIECGSGKSWAKEACCPGYECDPSRPGQCIESVPSQKPSEVPSYMPSHAPSKEPTTSHVPTDLPTPIGQVCAYDWRQATECGSTAGWAREECCPGYICNPNKPGQCKANCAKENRYANECGYNPENGAKELCCIGLYCNVNQRCVREEHVGCATDNIIAKDCGTTSKNAPQSCCSGFECDNSTWACVASP